MFNIFGSMLLLGVIFQYFTTMSIWRTTKPKSAKSETSPIFIPGYYMACITDRYKGICVIATTFIQKGMWIREYIGEVIEKSEFNGYEKYSFQLLDKYIVDASRIYNISRYINHSCGPNCEVHEIYWDGLPHLAIISTRKIDVHEEITISYGYEKSDPQNFDGSRYCRCGAPNCIDK